MIIYDFLEGSANIFFFTPSYQISVHMFARDNMWEGEGEVSGGIKGIQIDRLLKGFDAMMFYLQNYNCFWQCIGTNRS